MIGSVAGKIIERGRNFVIIETVSGLGFKVTVGPKAIKSQDSIRLYTYHHVREDLDDLYGFADLKDLEFFELLLSVNGVGPKMAMTIVTELGKANFVQAVMNGTVSSFKSIAGVGQKMAERIIIELKGKLGSSISLADLDRSDELAVALSSLGYKADEINKIINKVDPTLPLAAKLKEGLKLLTRV